MVCSILCILQEIFAANKLVFFTVRRDRQNCSSINFNEKMITVGIVCLWPLFIEFVCTQGSIMQCTLLGVLAEFHLDSLF